MAPEFIDSLGTSSFNTLDIHSIYYSKLWIKVFASESKSVVCNFASNERYFGMEIHSTCFKKRIVENVMHV